MELPLLWVLNSMQVEVSILVMPEYLIGMAVPGFSEVQILTERVAAIIVVSLSRSLMMVTVSPLELEATMVLEPMRGKQEFITGMEAPGYSAGPISMANPLVINLASLCTSAVTASVSRSAPPSMTMGMAAMPVRLESMTGPPQPNTALPLVNSTSII